LSARFNVSLTVNAAKSSGLALFNVPRLALPTGVRAPATITASFTIISSFDTYLFTIYQINVEINYVMAFLLLTYVAFFVALVAHRLSLRMLLFLNQALLVHR